MTDKSDWLLDGLYPRNAETGYIITCINGHKRWETVSDDGMCHTIKATMEGKEYLCWDYHCENIRSATGWEKFWRRVMVKKRGPFVEDLAKKGALDG